MKSALNYMEKMGSFALLVSANVHVELCGLLVADGRRGQLLASVLLPAPARSRSNHQS